MVQYTVRLPDGNEYGPADLHTLRGWHKDGRIGDDAWVWAEGTPEWVPLARVLAGTKTQPPTPHAPEEAAPGAPVRAPARPQAPAQAPAQRAAPAARAPQPGATPQQRPAPVARERQPRPRTDGRRPAARPAAAAPDRRWMLLAGAGVLVLLAMAAAFLLLARPFLERRQAANRLREQALPEGRFGDSALGLMLEARDGWLLLKPDSPLLLAPSAKARLVHPERGALATLTLQSRPPGLRPLDAFLDDVMAERGGLISGYRAGDRGDARLAGRTARRLAGSWTETGAEQRALALATQDAWSYVGLLVWAPASRSEELESAAAELSAGLSLTGALTQRVARQATPLLAAFPELSRPTVELLLRERPDAGLDATGLAAALVRAVDAGIEALSPAERRELARLYTGVYAPLGDAERERLAAWQRAVRADARPSERETAAVRQAQLDSLGAMPGETLVKLQALNEKAVFLGYARR